MSKVQITIHDISAHNEKAISVCGTDNTDKLDSILGIQDPHQWIFDGHILSRSFSLLFYGIKDGAHLYLYRQNDVIIQQKVESERLSKLPLRKNSQNSTLSNERLRIKDVLYQRIEGNRQSHRKLIKAFNHFEMQSEAQQTHTTTISDITATEPSTANLPLLWQVQSTKN